MAGAPGIGFAVALNGLLLVGALAALAYLYVARSARGVPEDRLEEWYDEAAALAREVRELADGPRPADRDRIDRRILPLSHRLRGHAREAPGGVDERVARDLYDLGSACYEIGMERRRVGRARAGVFLEDELDEIGADAEALERAVAARR